MQRLKDGLDAPKLDRVRTFLDGSQLRGLAALNDGSATISTKTEVTYEDGRKGSISATLEIRDAKVFPRKAMAAE